MLMYAAGRDPEGVSYQELRSGLHYRAVVIMAGQEDGVDSYVSKTTRPPLLMIQSDADQCLSPTYALTLYRDIHQNDKWFLELRTAHHLPPFDGVDVPAFDAVARTTSRFFQITLKGAQPASGLTAYGNEDLSVAQMFYGGNGPAMPNAPS